MSSEDENRKKLEEALAELAGLKEENLRLRTALNMARGETGDEPFSHVMEAPAGSVTANSAAKDKITLFRSVFRGRDDVYAVRWESRTGKCGYSPVRFNKTWAHEKSKQTTLNHSRDREFIPLTDQVIYDHLLGQQTIGIYPLLRDETCWFLAVDFDKSSWKQDMAAFLSTCHELKLSAALERSRSGQGGHIWFFFDAPIPAAFARKLGCAILTQTMERRYELGLNSYDRLFPNQDTMPRGGFGNLIALPLQGGPRRQGNSLFLNGDFVPYPDQWAFLSSLKRMSLKDVDTIVREAQGAGRVLGVRLSLDDADEASSQTPWFLTPVRKEKLDTEPLPDQVGIIQGNLVYVEKQGLPTAWLNRLIRLAAFQNSDFYRAQAMRLSTYGKPRIISCAQEFPLHIGLPRGCLQDVVRLLESHGVKVSMRDERFSGDPIDCQFCGKLLSLQKQAMEVLMKHDTGILSASTAFGKTVVAAAVIGARQVNTLVLVHRSQLLDQWRERLATFLEGPQSIGQIGGGKQKRTQIVDVGMIQTLNKAGKVNELVADYGLVVVDECHHISAFSFEQVLKQVRGRYVLGLTATPVRKDGHHPIITMQCGPIRFKVDSKPQAAKRPFDHVVIPRYTALRMPNEGKEEPIHEVFATLAADTSRNDLIFDDLVAALDTGRSPLFLTERTKHLKEFAERLKPFCRNVIVLKGGMGTRQRQTLAEEISNLQDGAERVILATGRYIGEGFDDARLDTLFLAMPISWKGTLQQYVGRLHRLHTNKREVQVYDYVDVQIPVLKRMYERRCKGYRALGYSIRG